MIPLTMREAAEELGARLLAPDDESFEKKPLPAISIDSRTIADGEAFVAIRGLHRDGHAYVQDALARGAALIVSSLPPGSPDLPPPGARTSLSASSSPAVPWLIVDDTTRALQEIGRLIRTRWGGPLLGITGSAGKTTTRLFTAQLVGAVFAVHQSPGNLNNEYGVPLALQGLAPEHDWCVLELGMNHAGEIRRLGEICRPTAGLITNIGAAHLEFFEDIEAIARAKAELLEGLPRDGTFFYNADDDRLRDMAERWEGEKVGFSLRCPSDVRIEDVQAVSMQETRFKLRIREKSLDLRLAMVGDHYLYDVAAAAAAAFRAGVPLEALAAAVPQLVPPSMRGRLRSFVPPGQEPILVWDDSYNSSPEALRAVLSAFRAAPGPGRRIVVLGDMLELGPASREIHRRAGQWAAAAQPDLLAAVGAFAEPLAEGAMSAGIDAAKVLVFADAEAAAEEVAKLTAPGDRVLVKGSRGIALEKVVERIRATTPSC